MQLPKLPKRQLLCLLGTSFFLGLAPFSQEMVAVNFTAPTFSLVDASCKLLAKKTELTKEQRSIASLARLK